jgi:von Willebrand factor type A C-terminal domain/von Willebrand factor type A domain
VAEFRAEVFQNEYLSDGATDVHGVVSVTCSGAGIAGQASGTEAAEVIIVDTSGSMDMPPAKIAAARRAAKVAVEEIVDGTWFAVLSGHTVAQMVYPPHPGLAKMTDVTRRDALEAVGRLRSGGATAIGAWIAAATELFQQAPAGQRHAILLTDGKIEGEPDGALEAALVNARGVFQCDCRGIGSDWVVEELRTIATALLGTVDIVAEPADLEADFEEMMRNAMSRGVADARLRVWAPQGSEVLFVRQVAPLVDDLTPRATRISPLVVEFPTGAWSDESRDYHIAVRVPSAPVGNERLAARVEVVIDDQVVAKALVKAIWSVDTNLTTRIDPAVAHYTGQAQLADVIQRGLAAKASGDDRTATVLLGEAAKLAHDSGNEDTTRLLNKVVDVVDVEAGTVRLKQQVAKSDEMALDTRSTKTTRIRREP